MIRVRPATETDVPSIRDIFMAVYRKEYPYNHFYDESWLKRAVFGEDVLMFVAEDSKSKKILGTASVICDIGAYSDLAGEFGRLAVNPDARSRGVGTLLMKKRIQSIEDRLHVALIEARMVHPYAQKIGIAHGFVPVGFLPLKFYLAQKRESLALLVRYFGDALALRKNNPRVIPEVFPVAQLAMGNLGMRCDVIVDEETGAYPPADGFKLDELTAQGLPSLLRIERGRVRRREIYGQMRLEYGFFRLRGGHATYLLARSDDQIAGAIGFTLDRAERAVRVFELITSTDQAVRYLLSELEGRCREQWGIDYIEIDVSAHATWMQRTLLELNFLPVAYVPAMVFQNVERLDIVRMVRLPRSHDLGDIVPIPPVKKMADLVMKGFGSRVIAPRIAKAASDVPLFRGFSRDQLTRFASACSLKRFEREDTIFKEKEKAGGMYILLGGKVRILLGRPPVQIGSVGKGEMLGEISMLASDLHSGAAVAETRVEAALITHQDLAELIRMRPDIGLCLYRNLSMGLGKKLIRSDVQIRRLLSKGSAPVRRK